ncbi:hypothetical protein [Ensifer sp. M14]|uniref:hypothetical protein n=1 Tax=Ensifer sp. M14 TaxID=2203782 RepID=UPI0018F61F4A
MSLRCRPPLLRAACPQRSYRSPLDKGIGCLTAERYKALFDELVKVKLLKPDTDHTRAFDTRFSCKRVGMSLKD